MRAWILKGVEEVGGEVEEEVKLVGLDIDKVFQIIGHKYAEAQIKYQGI